MQTMHRLKAYFGMVPADEMVDYLDDDDESEVADDSGYSRAHRSDRSGRSRIHDPAMRPDRGRVRDGEPVRTGSAAVVRGSLAMDEYYDDEDDYRMSESAAVRREPSRLPTSPGSSSVDRSGPCRITTLQPRSYNEARTVGERYRDGSPVIMNLSELDDAAAKRLVDFAAGLAFALRGSIDKVTNRVFLLSPPGVEVAPSDARRLAEHGLFSQD